MKVKLLKKLRRDIILIKEDNKYKLYTYYIRSRIKYLDYENISFIATLEQYHILLKNAIKRYNNDNNKPIIKHILP